MQLISTLDPPPTTILWCEQWNIFVNIVKIVWKRAEDKQYFWAVFVCLTRYYEATNNDIFTSLWHWRCKNKRAMVRNDAGQRRRQLCSQPPMVHRNIWSRHRNFLIVGVRTNNDTLPAATLSVILDTSLDWQLVSILRGLIIFLDHGCILDPTLSPCCDAWPWQ